MNYLETLLILAGYDKPRYDYDGAHDAFIGPEDLRMMDFKDSDTRVSSGHSFDSFGTLRKIDL